jgi:hypothetical protein
VGKRGRKRSTADGQGQHGSLSAGDLQVPVTVYADDEGNQLELRGSLTLKARSEYTSTLAGGLNREDAWQRAIELLFERLAVAWTVAGVRTDRQKELLGRYRIASAPERRFIRDSLRAHVAENFPELEAP